MATIDSHSEELLLSRFWFWIITDEKALSVYRFIIIESNGNLISKTMVLKESKLMNQFVKNLKTILTDAKY